MSIILDTQEYLDSQNANFCGGVAYACDQLEAYLQKKRTITDIKKWLENTRSEAIKTRKELTVKKPKSNVSVLK